MSATEQYFTVVLINDLIWRKKKCYFPWHTGFQHIMGVSKPQLVLSSQYVLTMLWHWTYPLALHPMYWTNPPWWSTHVTMSLRDTTDVVWRRKLSKVKPILAWMWLSPGLENDTADNPSLLPMIFAKPPPIECPVSRTWWVVRLITCSLR